VCALKKALIIIIISLFAMSCMPVTHIINSYAPDPTMTASPTVTQVETPTETPTAVPATATPTLFIPTPTPVEVLPELPAEHLVVEGDSITAISAKYGVPWGYVADYNDLDNPDLILAGQILTIPVWPPEESGKLILVVLSEQKTYAIEDGEVLKEFVVSTGTSNHPTVTGSYPIYVKYEFDDMEGGEGADYYYLKDVPSVMYFFQGYGLHGTYWHSNFGTPMSHGCVNLTKEDAAWLFGWANVGDIVKVIE
jgi:lipoprotein-anchoring transpeptidase ErfK/SrfK